MGDLGDIGVETTHEEEVIDILNHTNKIQRPKNDQKHHVYYKASRGWKRVDKGRRGYDIPCTKHPIIGTLIVLEVFSFTWRNVRNYYGNSNRKIFDQLDSTPQDRGAVELSTGMGNGNSC
jgi:hypothetical protein